MAQVIISYEEYQDLLSAKSIREKKLEDALREIKDEKWQVIDNYQKLLVKITKYPGIKGLNEFLYKNYKFELRHYFSGSDRLERVDYSIQR
jgi:hypothetical protein